MDLEFAETPFVFAHSIVRTLLCDHLDFCEIWRHVKEKIMSNFYDSKLVYLGKSIELSLTDDVMLTFM